jgi:hypothetical protein
MVRRTGPKHWENHGSKGQGKGRRLAGHVDQQIDPDLLGRILMRKLTIFGASLVFLVASACWLWSDDSKNEPGQRYVLLATTRTSTMQKEMSDAGAQGFRVRMGAPTAGNEMVILMEKLATPADPFQYRILATTRTGTMEKELNEAGDAGFRILPQTMIAKKGTGLGGYEIVVVLEKAPKSASRYKYKLLATSRTSTMEKEIREAEDAGFALTAICSRDEHIVIMEREIK